MYVLYEMYVVRLYVVYEVYVVYEMSVRAIAAPSHTAVDTRRLR